VLCDSIKVRSVVAFPLSLSLTKSGKSPPKCVISYNTERPKRRRFSKSFENGALNYWKVWIYFFVPQAPPNGTGLEYSSQQIAKRSHALG
jgi:hypothetical protein